MKPLRIKRQLRSSLLLFAQSGSITLSSLYFNHIILTKATMGNAKLKEKKGNVCIGTKMIKKAEYGSKGRIVNYEPEYECTGRSTNPADKQCPCQLKSPEAMWLSLGGWEGRLLRRHADLLQFTLSPNAQVFIYQSHASIQHSRDDFAAKPPGILQCDGQTLQKIGGRDILNLQ